MGKRMRPHTLTIPKPLIPIAGKPIVQRLVEDIAKVCGKPINEIAFVIGRFGAEVEAHLIQVAAEVGAKGRIFYQDEALGTAHAVQCAKDCLQGEVVVAFADTLFKADFTIDTGRDGVIFVQKVADPSAFGVVTIGADGHIEGFVEKPKSFVSDLAIIGIYFFKDGAYLRNEIQYLLDHDIKDKGEYQITNALENMKNKGTKFFPGSVTEWLDCGNSDATVHTNSRYLSYLNGQNLVANDALLQDSVVIQPSYIGKGVKIIRSVVGPYASVGDGSMITDSRVQESIVLKNSSVKNSLINGSMIGNHTTVEGKMDKLSLGDYSTITE